MTKLRRDQVIDPQEPGIYHCWNKVVQDSYLCGVDRDTQCDYSHRKEWVIERLEELAGIFLIDLGRFAVLDNHLHLILRNRPDMAQALTDEEVLRRWRALYPRRSKGKGKKKRDKGKVIIPSPTEIARELRQAPEKVAEYRRRLSSVSWYMKELQQPIGRRANLESGKSGNFWKSRFQAQRLLDDEAVAACALYVDLNEVRARIAHLPEDARHSSVWQQLEGRRQRVDDFLAPAPSAPDLEADLEADPGSNLEAEFESDLTAEFESDLEGDWGAAGRAGISSGVDQRSAARPGSRPGSGPLSERELARVLETPRPTDRDYWMAPVNEEVALESLASGGRATEFTDAPRPASATKRGGWLAMTLDQYLTLLDWTGRELRGDKRGAIPSDVAPILERLKLDAGTWCALVASFEGSRLNAVGTAEALRDFARRMGRAWMWGVKQMKRLFGR